MLQSVDLSGEWRFALDRNHEGVRDAWFSRELAEHVALPGSTDEWQKGDFVDERCEDRLSRQWRWIGPAWYQRDVAIPECWAGMHIELFMERTKDSQVWVDDQWMGYDDSLSTPHVVDLSDALSPGTHTLTVLVDNAKLPPVGPCHQVDERTQTNWNGILGRIELTMSPKVRLADLQIFPNAKKRELQVAAVVENETRWSGASEMTYTVSMAGHEDGPPLATIHRAPGIKHGRNGFKETIPLPEDAPLWDEFTCQVLRVTMRLDVMPEAARWHDELSVECGLRDLAAERGQFVVNGRPTFFRGKNDCALFPLTGYAPMEKAEWVRLLSISRDYGINHYRFHSWCPPGAAFAAADEVGIYFHVELPNKREINLPDNHDYQPPKEAYETLDELEGDGGPPAVRTAYLLREGDRILKAYGNHPSFVAMTLGNELGGDVEVMRDMCDHFRDIDRRHLYAIGTGAFHWDVKYREGNEFWVTRKTADGLHVRDASFGEDLHIEAGPPGTMFDYEHALRGVPVPVVAHETGQFETYPDYREIKEYTGVLRARNLEIFRNRLEKAGMLDQALAFVKASGALSVICHREGVEASLRTRGFGGFQMLDLQDFSGQGTALVGILNVFMQSKGLITPGAWREFCCETVPLLEMKRYTWCNDEWFRARIRVAHYGPGALMQQSVSWQLRSGRKVLAKGVTDPVDIQTGTVTDIDLIGIELSSVTEAAKLSLVLSLKGTQYRNRYDVWVYPAKVTVKPAAGVRVVRKWSKRVERALEAGERVLLMPQPESLTHAIDGAFQSSFWCWPMFRNTALKNGMKVLPGTLGILCDPDHPLFAHFPTEFHSNWQWWHLVKNGRSMIFDETECGFRPTLQVIDNFARNHKLGLIAEAQVGKGRVVVCSIDLPGLKAYPEARQLMHSINAYMKSAAFKPKQTLSSKTLKALVS